MMKLIRVAFVLAALSLSACVAAVVAGAGAAAGLVVYDKRSMDMIRYDTRLFHDVHEAIVSDKAFNDSRIVVSSFNRNILLTGQTPTASLRPKAVSIARSVKGVGKVYLQIAVADPISLSQQSSDAWITGQVKAGMMTKKGLRSSSFKVVTEHNVVYLMGSVNHEQANLATDVARRVKGVSKVVKIFQYID